MTAPEDPYSSGEQPGPGQQGAQAGYPAAGYQTGGYQTGGYQTGGYQTGGYQTGGYGAGAPAQRRNGLGVAALVLGILAVVTSFTVIGGILLGLVAVVLGVLGRGRARRGEADNGGMALAGVVLGLIGIVLSAALIAFGVSLLNSPKGQQYQDCLKRAQGDRAAVQQCAQQYSQTG